MRRIRRVVLAAVAAAALFGLPAQATPPVPQKDPSALPKSWTGDLIVKFRETSDTPTGRQKAYRAAQAQSRAARPGHDKRRLAVGSTLVAGGSDPQGLLKSLRARSDVEYAVPNRRIKRATNDPQWSLQWGLSGTWGINIAPMWARTTGRGVKVAVLDTGRTAHPDLAGAFVGGYDFVDDPLAGGDGDARDADPTDTGDWCTEPGYESGSSWHGTGVAGTIAARRDNNVGIAGAAPSSSIVPVRVLGRCGGTEADLVDALMWAAGITVSGVPTNPNPARILNLSLGGMEQSACSPAMQSAINATRQRGALTVVASGNQGADASTYAPGNCAGVVNVASHDSSGTRSWFSNHGATIDLSAPGGQVPVLAVNSTTTNNGQYGVALADGTSFATPLVSAVAADILAIQPNLTLAQVEWILTRSVRPDASCSGCGAGVLDAAVAASWVPWPGADLPRVRSLSTTRATAGTVVTVTGTNFLPGAKVDVQGVPASGVTVVSPTSLRFTVPAGTSGARAIVHVTTSLGVSSATKGSVFTWA